MPPPCTSHCLCACERPRCPVFYACLTRLTVRCHPASPPQQHVLYPSLLPLPFTAAAVIGKSDPYAVVRVGATGHSFHEKGEAGAHESMTKTIDNNEDPVWDEEFTLAYDVVRSRQW